MRDEKYNIVLASLVAIVAIAGLMINFANVPTGALHGEWARSTSPIGTDPSLYDLGVEIAKSCEADLLAQDATDRPGSVPKLVTLHDWESCHPNRCQDACEQLGFPNECVDLCIAGADRYFKARFTLFPTDEQ